MTGYKRVLLKLTGESFGGQSRRGLDFSAVRKLAENIKAVIADTGVQLAIVNGGGNLFRGREHHEGPVDAAQMDYIGMLGTVMNSLALQEELIALGHEARVMSSLHVDQACEPFIRKKAINDLDKGYVVILAGGTGNPFFTTDSAAALKAAELHADLLLKGTNVDGVYDCDPHQNDHAVKFSEITFTEALRRGLTVMDATAFALCGQQKIPVVVFDITDFNNVTRIIRGEKIGTLVTP
jgi:uridylate kinase